MTVIAIDGPAGAGKSSVGRALAEALSYSYLDTGAMYRAVALAVLERGVTPEDEGAVAALAGALDVDVRAGRTLVEGRDVGERIRSEDVTSIVSLISSYAAVRQRLTEIQRRLLERDNIVIEGRDIGTSVAPEADIKIYLTASLKRRAQRRAVQSGVASTELPKIEMDLERRDRADAGRRESPLMRAAGSHVVDSTDLSLEGVVARIAALVQGQEQ